MANYLEQLDSQIGELFASWNVYTTVLVLVFATFVVYPLVFSEEPDTHPLLLARQARPSPVRNVGESATYRSLEVPHGYPLRTGLNVKDADAPRWSAGRDGDLRDVWRAFVQGSPEGAKSKIMTVFGKDIPDEYDVAQISMEINILGSYMKAQGASSVAIYLPNSIEYLATLFAASFYGLSVVLIPFNQPHEVVVKLLQETAADCLIANAGSLPLETLCSRAPDLKSVTWVVEKTSRHMDWTGAPGGAQSKVVVSVWHDLVQENDSRSTSTLPFNAAIQPSSITHVWLKKQGSPGEIVQFTQQNLIAAIAALSSAPPMRQRLGPSDLLLPADSFSNSYVLCQTLAAMYSHASLAINSVAGPGVDLSLASMSIAPTVIIASAESIASLHKSSSPQISGPLQKILHASQASTLAAGRMVSSTTISGLLGSRVHAIGSTPGKLRLILVSERSGTDAPALSGTMLSDIRIFTQARLCYALTVPRVAGAVSQTSLFDYRNDNVSAYNHFGVPLSCLEIKLINKNDAQVDGNCPSGEVLATGPSVLGGAAKLGIQGQFREDSTLAYAS